MHVEIHLIAEAAFFHKLSQLFQCVEETHATTSIKVIWFDEPHIFAKIHFIVHSELA